jgi:hypothetical protein
MVSSKLILILISIPILISKLISILMAAVGSTVTGATVGEGVTTGTTGEGVAGTSTGDSETGDSVGKLEGLKDGRSLGTSLVVVGAGLPGLGAKLGISDGNGVPPVGLSVGLTVGGGRIVSVVGEGVGNDSGTSGQNSRRGGPRSLYKKKQRVQFKRKEGIQISIMYKISKKC